VERVLEFQVGEVLVWSGKCLSDEGKVTKGTEDTWEGAMQPYLAENRDHAPVAGAAQI
jgi:hypothetical protein